MNGNELINLIGKTISSLSVQKMLKHFKYNEPEKGFYSGDIFEEELSIEFLSRCSFESEYTDPPYKFENEDYIEPPFENPDLPQLEFIISQIHFSKKFKSTLPFDLKWNDSLEKIKKLGKANGKSKNSEGTKIWYFLKDNYNIQIAINKKDKIEWVRVWLIDNMIKKSLKLKETIKIQNKNIIPENHILVNQFKDKKPTIKWYKELIKEESFYTKESIDETDKVLTKFVDDLIIATKEKKANKILTSLKKTILSLNKLEEKFGHIETIEREELCPFLLNVVESTGFKCDYDLTEEWRTW